MNLQQKVTRYLDQQQKGQQQKIVVEQQQAEYPVNELEREWFEKREVLPSNEVNDIVRIAKDSNFKESLVYNLMKRFDGNRQLVSEQLALLKENQIQGNDDDWTQVGNQGPAKQKKSYEGGKQKYLKHDQEQRDLKPKRPYADKKYSEEQEPIEDDDVPQQHYDKRPAYYNKYPQKQPYSSKPYNKQQPHRYQPLFVPKEPLQQEVRYVIAERNERPEQQEVAQHTPKKEPAQHTPKKEPEQKQPVEAHHQRHTATHEAARDSGKKEQKPQPQPQAQPQVQPQPQPSPQQPKPQQSPQTQPQPSPQTQPLQQQAPPHHPIQQAAHSSHPQPVAPVQQHPHPPAQVHPQPHAHPSQPIQVPAHQQMHPNPHLVQHPPGQVIQHPHVQPQSVINPQHQQHVVRSSPQQVAQHPIKNQQQSSQQQQQQQVVPPQVQKQMSGQTAQPPQLGVPQTGVPLVVQFLVYPNNFTTQPTLFPLTQANLQQSFSQLSQICQTYQMIEPQVSLPMYHQMLYQYSGQPQKPSQPQ